MALIRPIGQNSTSQKSDSDFDVLNVHEGETIQFDVPIRTLPAPASAAKVEARAYPSWDRQLPAKDKSTTRHAPTAGRALDLREASNDLRIVQIYEVEQPHSRGLLGSEILCDSSRSDLKLKACSRKVGRRC